MNYIIRFILTFILSMSILLFQDYNRTTIDYGKMMEPPNETITFENISYNYKINYKLNKYLSKY